MMNDFGFYLLGAGRASERITGLSRHAGREHSVFAFNESIGVSKH